MFNSITLVIIVSTCVISLAGFRNGKIIDELIFWPPAISKRHQYYRFISCGLIHADYMHLIFNMVTLYFFGTIMETALSGRTGSAKMVFPGFVPGGINCI